MASAENSAQNELSTDDVVVTSRYSLAKVLCFGDIGRISVKELELRGRFEIICSLSMGLMFLIIYAATAPLSDCAYMNLFAGWFIAVAIWKTMVTIVHIVYRACNPQRSLEQGTQAHINLMQSEVYFYVITDALLVVMGLMIIIPFSITQRCIFGNEIPFYTAIVYIVIVLPKIIKCLVDERCCCQSVPNRRNFFDDVHV